MVRPYSGTGRGAQGCPSRLPQLAGDSLERARLIVLVDLPIRAVEDMERARVDGEAMRAVVPGDESEAPGQEPGTVVLIDAFVLRVDCEEGRDTNSLEPVNSEK